jgi:hypothetical protein
MAGKEEDPNSLSWEMRQLVNERLEALKMPYKHSRRARSFSATSWKALEYYNFTLYYFPVVMDGILVKQTYNHYMKFVKAMRLLS